MRKKKQNKQIDPIIFMNTPISDDKDDVIGINSSVDSIKHAIENDAKMIGIIADYGSGKSSLTETLIKDKKLFGGAIIVNMWDSLSQEPLQENSSKANISTLTKAFLFQLASGISDNVAKHVNRRLSRNYNIISFSISSWKFWCWAVLAAFLYALSAFTSGIGVNTLGQLITTINPNIVISDLFFWTNVLKYSSPIFFVAAIVSTVIGVRGTNIAFSHWKAQNNREPEVNDVFEVFIDLHKRLTGLFSKRRLIIIEDLDRIDNKKLIVGFLKEIYRFNGLPQKRKSNSPIFIISVKPEYSLKEGTKGSSVNGTAAFNDEVYTKIFDYTIILKPIHYTDYGEILLKIIGDDNSPNKIALQNILEKKDRISETLPDSFSWLQKGNNLTIRQLKDRLNSAVSLLVTLKNKNYENQPCINFSSCAAVAYLESQYPMQYSELISKENEFSKLVQSSFSIRNDSDLVNKKTRMNQAVAQFFKDTKDNSLQMQSDIMSMLLNGDISDDFRMYFYSFPKGSYIMNGDERDISNLLQFPNDYPNDDKINEKIERILAKNKGSSIKKIITKIGVDEQQVLYPPIIIQDQFLFWQANTINFSKTLNTVNKIATWENDKLLNSQEAIGLLSKYSFDGVNVFWSKYAESLSVKLDGYSEELKVEVRKRITNIFGNRSSIFKELFRKRSATKAAMPIITKEELDAILDIDVAIALINDELINEGNIGYISDFINQLKLEIKTYEIAHQIYSNAIKSLPTETLWKPVVKFLKINKAIDVEFFSYALSDSTSDNFDKELVASYLNSLSSSQIPKEYLDQIESAVIDVNLSDEILKQLYDNKNFVALLSSISKTKNLSFVDFTAEDDQETIISACEKFISYDDNLIPKIRLEIIKQFKKKGLSKEIPDVFSDLFYGDYPMISSEEICEVNSVSIMLRLLNRELVTTSNSAEIVSFINNNSIQEECLTNFKLLFGDYDDKYPEDSIAMDIINSLDYQKIGFCDLDIENKEKALEFIGKQINLSDPQIANDFMNKSNSLIPSLEQVVVDSGKTQIYIDTINQIDSPTEYTIEWLINNEVSFALSPTLSTSMLESGQEDKYLIGKVLYEEAFEFPYPNVSDTTVINNYKTNSLIWSSIKDDRNLVNYILQNEFYKSFEEAEFPDVLRPLYNGKQTIAFVEFLFDKVSNEEKLHYLDQMGEIFDAENSIAISIFLTDNANIDLLQDNDLFYKVRERLWEEAPKHSGYKGVFTRKRNQKFPTD